MSTRRRPTTSSPLFKILMAILVVGILGVLVYASGLLSRKTVETKPDRTGKVPIPKSLVELKAFEKVRREDVFDREKGDDSYFWLSREAVERNPDWVTSIDQVIGRVMAKDKRADFVFRKSDFLPEGSRTGLMGGVPEGKQGFFLSVEKVPGVRYLKKGDRFDLLVNLPDESEEQAAEYGLLMGGIKVQAGKPIPVNGIRVIARQAELIALTTDKIMTTQGRLKLQAKDERGREIRINKGEERVLIAISPEESVPLTDALGREYPIHAVVQSGQRVEQNIEDQLDGMVAFPANAVEIKAFTKITGKDLAEPANGNLRRYYFKAGDAQNGWIAKAEDLIGKVVNRDIEPGYIFTAADFLDADHVIADVEAFESLQPSHLVAGIDSKWVGKVVARSLQSGEKITNDKILGPGSLIREVKEYQALAAADLVEGTASTWLGKTVRSELAAGHQLSESDLLPVGSVTRDVAAFELLSERDLAGRHESKWVGRVTARKLKAGQLVEDSMLLAAGSQPGISSAIPPGRFAMTFPVDAGEGFSRLSNGDRIDILETSTFSLNKALGGVRVSEKLAASLGNNQVNKVVAADVLVVDQNEKEIVLAVKAAEVSSLTKSLASENANVTAIARSNQQAKSQNPMDNQPPDPGKAVIESDPNPLDAIIVTRMIIDGQKSEMAFRRTDRD